MHDATNAEKARASARSIRASLESGARGTRRLTLLLCAELETMADALAAAERERADHAALLARHDDLVVDWNALVAGLEAAGIVVRGTALTHALGPWRWEAGGQAGEAASIAAAYLAAPGYAAERAAATEPRPFKGF